VDVVKTRRTKMEELATLNTKHKTQTINPDLIDQLPEIDFDLGQLPEAHQRRLFDAFQLELRYNKIHHQLTIRATVRGDMVEPHKDTVRQTDELNGSDTTKTARQPAGRTVFHAQ